MYEMPVAELSVGLPAPLSRGMLLVWSQRGDLQRRFPLSNMEQRRAFLAWCIIQGRKEYRLLNDTISMAVLEGASAASMDGVSAFMRMLWEGRPDLRTRYDLSSEETRAGYIIWYLTAGRTELGLAQTPLPAWQSAWLQECVKTPEGREDPPITRQLLLVWLMRRDLRFLDLTAREGRQGFFRWYMLNGLRELSLPVLLSPDQSKFLLAPSSEEGGPSEVPRLLWWIWGEREDIRSAFPLTAIDHVVSFKQWFMIHGQRELGLIREDPAATVPAAPVSALECLREGVDLLGCLPGQGGADDVVRMAARACTEAEIPFSIMTFDSASVKRDPAERLQGAAEHRALILCMTGPDSIRAFSSLGASPFAGRTVIGYWPWELPERPEDWIPAFDLIDELWVPSRFAEAAFTPLSPVPVVHMPTAVMIDPPADPSRARFGLPPDCYVFAFAFDGMLSYERKNPFAVAVAFMLAFPLGTERVRLAIAVGSPREQDPQWKRLRALAARDTRISLVKSSSKSETIDLCAACDAFVSLHRSEGFGREIAEAMLLGKPVVTTSWSGNMDFCMPDTALLVQCEMVAAGPGSGLVWAAPDELAAAVHMRALAADPAYGVALGVVGRALVEAKHAPVVTGRSYAERLQVLGALTKAAARPVKG